MNINKDIYLAAHGILEMLSKKSYKATSLIDGTEIHKPYAYQSTSLREINEKLKQKDIYTIKYAVELLYERKEIDKIDNLDWYKIEIKCTNKGEESYRRKTYHKEHNDHKVSYYENWAKRYWIPITLFSFLVGSILAPISVEFAKQKLWPEYSPNKPTVEGISCNRH